MQSRFLIHIYLLVFLIAFAGSQRVKKTERPSYKACQSYYQSMQFSFARAASLQLNVLGGIRTRIGEFSYMVALGWESSETTGSYNYKCGGVLIDPHFVLTAAHCVSPSKPVVVLPGGVELVASSTQTYNISKVIPHPKYKTGEIYNDIALIQLQQPIISMTHKPVCLWGEKRIAEDLTVIATGYGLTESGGQRSQELLKAPLVTMPNRECNGIFKKFNRAPRGIISSQVCAKDPNVIRATCKGDSGGPIVYEKNEGGVRRPYVLGITSQGVGCTTKFPGIYTRVSNYLNWIEKKVWNK